jgi:hypothetical protein
MTRLPSLPHVLSPTSYTACDQYPFQCPTRMRDSAALVYWERLRLDFPISSLTKAGEQLSCQIPENLISLLQTAGARVYPLLYRSVLSCPVLSRPILSCPTVQQDGVRGKGSPSTIMNIIAGPTAPEQWPDL